VLIRNRTDKSASSFNVVIVTGPPPWEVVLVSVNTAAPRDLWTNRLAAGNHLIRLFQWVCSCLNICF